MLSAWKGDDVSAGLLYRPGTGLNYAIRTLNRELFEFHFDYPLEDVPEAAVPGSLHYHLESECLFLEDVVFDRQGIAMKVYRAQGPQHNPLFIAWWGLVNLERFLRGSNQADLERFLAQVRWLKSHAVKRDDGAVVWPCYFDWQEGRCRLTAPWISAMYQGMIISALVRAFQVTGDEQLLELCDQATRVFEKNIEDGGVRTVERGRIVYEEYPAYPLPRVLDGYLVSLLGLYDLYTHTRDTRVLNLFSQGIDGLLGTISFWDYRKQWSWYGSHGYLCPPQYHKMNYVLLGVVGKLTGEKILQQYAERWHLKNRSRKDKLEIFLMFTLTKNWARLRLPRN